VQVGHKAPPADALQVHRDGVYAHVVEAAEGVEHDEREEQGHEGVGEGEPRDSCPEEACRQHQVRPPAQPIRGPPQSAHRRDRRTSADEQGDAQRPGREAQRTAQVRQEHGIAPPEEPEKAEG
jgi:hypothetical protein